MKALVMDTRCLICKTKEGTNKTKVTKHVEEDDYNGFIHACDWDYKS